MAWLTTRPSLLDRVKDPADHAAWLEFDRSYGELIVRYGRSRGLSLADAHDVRQVVLMNLLRAMPKFEYQPERGRFRSYLGRVVHNAVTRAMRCPRIPVAALENSVLSSLAIDETGQDERWNEEWVSHHLRRAMRTIRRRSDRKSLDVFDRLLAGRTVEQVACEFDMTSEAVRKVKQRVRGRLCELIADQIAEEGGE